MEMKIKENKMKYRFTAAIAAFVLLLMIFTYYHTNVKHSSSGFGNRTLFTNNRIQSFLKHPYPKQNVLKPDVKYSQAHQDEVVYEILQKKNGFFIEMGAFNGVQFSNTLWLERMYNWTGLLIEANPSLCKQIDKIKRNAWRLCACISTQKQVTFITGKALGGVKNNINSDLMKFLRKEAEITVPCFTLDQVLAELNIYRFDYFSLDVEGAEMFILTTIQKQLKEEKMFVGVWTIEYRVYDGRHVVRDKSIDNLQRIRMFFKDLHQYIEHSQLDNIPRSADIPDGQALDVVFVHKSLNIKN